MPSLKLTVRTGRGGDDEHFHMIEPDAGETGPAMLGEGQKSSDPHTHTVKEDAEVTGERDDHVHSLHDDGFGFGTRLHLGTEHVKKLFGDTMPEVGSVHTIVAVGVVKSVSKSEHDGDGEGIQMNVDVQLTHADFNPPKVKAARVLNFDATEEA